ncbi:Aste57867_21271 [Aphanomyces stellatus]|uniref:Aste57867_21271 protein n=1 Tax=Aphanomyces stellatus TaxID=120398 RepID=A0A485LID1_9STRA|nr:hypothetical protein As57867_021202 [Aphanomyces stellatus]VFT97943.1 Aste57867_21271 [Aphanomyces stellatus]
MAQLRRALEQHDASTRIQLAFRKKRAERRRSLERLQADSTCTDLEEPETEVHSDAGDASDDDDDQGHLVLAKAVANYTLTWTDGVLGLSFDVSFSTPVVRRVHASLSAVDGIDRVAKGDRLLAIGGHTLLPADNLANLLERMAPPVALTLAPWNGAVPTFSNDAVVTIGLAKNCRPRTASILTPDAFEVLVEETGVAFAWSPFKTRDAMVPMVHSVDGNADANPGLARLHASDVLVQIGPIATASLTYDEALRKLKDAPRPVVLRFQVGTREPHAWANHVVVCWSEGALGAEWRWDGVFCQGLEIQRMHAHGLVAQQKGLQVGDILLQINHQDTAEMGLDAALKMLTQHHPTPLQLTFQQTPAWKRVVKVVARVVLSALSDILAALAGVVDVFSDFADVGLLLQVAQGILVFCAIYYLDVVLDCVVVWPAQIVFHFLF